MVWVPPLEGVAPALISPIIEGPVPRAPNPTPAQTTAYNNLEAAQAEFKEADKRFNDVMSVYRNNRKAYDDTMSQITNLWSTANNAQQNAIWAWGSNGNAKRAEAARTAAEYSKAIANILVWQWPASEIITITGLGGKAVEERRKRPTNSSSSVNPNKKSLFELFGDTFPPRAPRNDAAVKINRASTELTNANTAAATAAAANAKTKEEQAKAAAAKKKADDEKAALEAALEQKKREEAAQKTQITSVSSVSGPMTSSGPITEKKQQDILNKMLSTNRSSISSVKNAAKTVRNGINATKLKTNLNTLVTRIQQLGGSRKNKRPGKKARRAKSRRVKKSKYTVYK